MQSQRCSTATEAGRGWFTVISVGGGKERGTEVERPAEGERRGGGSAPDLLCQIALLGKEKMNGGDSTTRSKMIMPQAIKPSSPPRGAVAAAPRGGRGRSQRELHGRRGRAGSKPARGGVEECLSVDIRVAKMPNAFLITLSGAVRVIHSIQTLFGLSQHRVVAEMRCC